MGDLKNFIIPAIDLKDGKVVRLFKGDYNQIKVYSQNPVETAKYFADLGFRRLHIVDLDGAKEGLPVNLKLLEKIRKTVECEIEFGGGIRTGEAFKKLFEELGIDYAVVGTLAVKNLQLFEEIIETYPNRVILSLDAKKGRVAVGGWLESTSLTPEEFAQKYETKPIWGYLYTVVEKDGTLAGVDIEPYKNLKRVVKKPVFASGGVASIEDIQKLVGIVDGVVVGRAIYEGKIDLEKL